MLAITSAKENKVVVTSTTKKLVALHQPPMALTSAIKQTMAITSAIKPINIMTSHCQLAQHLPNLITIIQGNNNSPKYGNKICHHWKIIEKILQQKIYLDTYFPIQINILES